MNDYLFLIIILALGLFLIELIAHKSRLSKPLLRKMAHVSMSLAVCFLGLFFDYRYFIIVGLIFTLFMIIMRLYRPLIALSDRSNTSLGELLFPLGIAMAAFIASDLTQFIVSVLILGICDTLAYTLGTELRSPKIIHDKTIIGSAGFLFSSLIILMVLLPPPLAIISATVLTICELFSPYGSDNFTIPVLAAILVSTLS